MAVKSNYASNAILGHMLGKTAWAMPAGVWAALVTALPVPTDTGATIAEIAYTGYARRAIAGADIAVPANSATSNANQWQWGQMTAGTGGTVQAVVFLDSATIGAGNVIRWVPLTTPLAVTVGTQPTVNAGQLTITES